MNKENILAVADAIEKHSIPGIGFNMADYICPTGKFGTVDHSGNRCGTVACIAGHAYVLETGEVDASGGGIHTMAQDYLGLLRLEADELFYAEVPGVIVGNITAEQAVSCLRHLAATGEVDWQRAMGFQP